MERVSEAVASGMGTVGFLLVSSSVIVAWVLTNHVVRFLEHSWKGLLHGTGFDPAPFILSTSCSRRSRSTPARS